MEVILGLFGLLNAGVLLGAAGGPTWIVLAALVAGKPIGIFLSGLLGTKLLRLQLSERIGSRELFVIGCAAGIGFTVALFVATVAFERARCRTPRRSARWLRVRRPAVAFLPRGCWGCGGGRECGVRRELRHPAEADPGGVCGQRIIRAPSRVERRPMNGE